jgi:hypothetical protein
MDEEKPFHSSICVIIIPNVTNITRTIKSVDNGVVNIVLEENEEGIRIGRTACARSGRREKSNVHRLGAVH